MNTGFQIARLLKDLSPAAGNERLARAMFVANTVGFHLRLDLAVTPEEFAEQNAKLFRGILNDVNESLSVDTKKAQELFRNVIRIRYELVNGVTDPSLIQAALASCTTEQNQTTKEFSTTSWLANRNDFARAQVEASAIMEAHGAKE